MAKYVHWLLNTLTITNFSKGKEKHARVCFFVLTFYKIETKNTYLAYSDGLIQYSFGISGIVRTR